MCVLRKKRKNDIAFCAASRASRASKGLERDAFARANIPAAPRTVARASRVPSFPLVSRCDSTQKRPARSQKGLRLPGIRRRRDRTSERQTPTRERVKNETFVSPSRDHRRSCLTRAKCVGNRPRRSVPSRLGSGFFLNLFFFDDTFFLRRRRRRRRREFFEEPQSIPKGLRV